MHLNAIFQLVHVCIANWCPVGFCTKAEHIFQLPLKCVASGPGGYYYNKIPEYSKLNEIPSFWVALVIEHTKNVSNWIHSKTIVFLQQIHFYKEHSAHGILSTYKIVYSCWWLVNQVIQSEFNQSIMLLNVYWRMHFFYINLSCTNIYIHNITINSKCAHWLCKL